MLTMDETMCDEKMPKKRCRRVQETKREESRKESDHPYGEGMTAAKSLPGENQSLADLNFRFVTRRLMPAAFFSWTLVLVADPVGVVRAGEGAGDAKQESEGGCSGDIEVESVQCVTNCCC